jgi:hypothetical protein
MQWSDWRRADAFCNIERQEPPPSLTLSFAEKMKTPIFKRRSMAFDMGNYYASNTDVWVYGSPAQYSAFATLLTTHKRLKRIPADDRGGMDLLILPIAGNVIREFLVIHERLVHQNGRFNMELIVGGSRVGFGLLAKTFRRSVRFHSGDPDDHFHIWCEEEALILPSVFLNIRGPVEDIDERFDELAPPSSDDLLPDMSWRDPVDWNYELLEDYASLFGRIPIATNSEPGRFSKPGHRAPVAIRASRRAVR